MSNGVAVSKTIPICVPFSSKAATLFEAELGVNGREMEALSFVRADRRGEREHLRMELSSQAQWHYAQL